MRYLYALMLTIATFPSCGNERQVSICIQVYITPDAEKNQIGATNSPIRLLDCDRHSHIDVDSAINMERPGCGKWPDVVCIAACKISVHLWRARRLTG